MRLQLDTIILTLLIACSWKGMAQQVVPTDSLTEREVDVNFLFGYYSQDGIHSAVTGGEGTEQLVDRDLKIIVNVPVDSISAVIVDTNLNYYSSASTDNIDLDVSSASSEDLRGQFYFTYQKDQKAKGSTFSVGAGGSVESDYLSTSVLGSWSKISKNGNQEFAVSGQVFFDRWVLIFPDELRDGSAELPATDKRRSYSISTAYSFVISKRLQASLLADVVYQKGMLATPFHRVFFEGLEKAKIEKLPGERLKFPIGIRFSYYLQDFLTVKSYHRYYTDDFGITSTTHSVETRVKLGRFFTVYPFYRFYQQTASDYFAPYRMHTPEEKYFTSDYDLSGFNSHKLGIGLRWSPLYGISKFKLSKRNKSALFKSLGIRYSHYTREDGLEADLIGFDFGFSVK